MLIENESLTIIDTKTSNYNSKVFMNQCSMPNCKEKPIDSHHIIFQKDADKKGNIDGRFHKNAGFNLAPLCEKHHADVTYDRMIIKGWKVNGDGVRRLHFKYINPMQETAPKNTNVPRTKLTERYTKKSK